MRNGYYAGLLGLLLLLPAAVSAQDTADDVGYVYVTYFICNPASEARADEIIERSFKPHYDAAVEAGNIASWSWLSHFVGGEWRRVLVLSATNMDDLLDASGALGEIIEETTPEAGRAFTEYCPRHVDYIWESIPGVGSAIGTDRGEAGYSTYLSCDVTREDRADELMAETFGPVYDARVAAGDLSSWTWLKHNVGGERRRLLALTGADHKQMSDVRAEILAEFRQRRFQRAWREFGSICPTHEDYLWDIRFETP